jgi:hypothetical protein
MTLWHVFDRLKLLNKYFCQLPIDVVFYFLYILQANMIFCHSEKVRLKEKYEKIRTFSTFLEL